MIKIFVLSLMVVLIQSLKPYLQVEPVHDDEDVKLT